MIMPFFGVGKLSFRAASPTVVPAIAAIALSLSFQSSVIAQTPTPTTTATTTTTAISSSESDVVKMPEFQVTTDSDRGYRAANSISATRVDTAIKDLPFAVSAFTQQFITDIGARDLWDVVQFAPGVTSSGREFNAGNAVYTIRGFDQRPQHDGFAGEAYIDTVNIERVEVVKGPA